MTYNRLNRPADRMITLVAVGAIHAAAFYAVITGLTVAFVPHNDPPPISATNSPLDPPPPPEPGRRPHRPEREIITVFTPVPTPLPTALPATLPSPLPTDAVNDGSRPGAGGDGSGSGTTPKPPPAIAPRLARPLGRPGDWVTEADYPTSSIRLGHAGVVGFALAISDSGRATGCEITRSSGFAELDALTCTLLLRRGRFQPATDDQGAATAGRYASAVRWQIPD